MGHARKQRDSERQVIVAGFKTKQRRDKRTGILRKTAIMAGVVAALAAVFFVILGTQPTTPTGSGQASAGYAVGSPAPGARAPDFSLPSTSGNTVNLSDYRGKAVLLFFHEGIGCQPCWDQIRDFDSAGAQLQSAGIDKLLTITSGPVDLIAQKMADDKLSAVALADTRLDVSRTYGANKYGMMGDSRDGHSLILVGPDGRIQWRADYGGPPNYTMYVPVARVLSDLQAGRIGK